MSTEFSNVVWQPLDLMTDDKMSQMDQNSQWIRDRLPLTHYTHGVNRTQGIKIVSGIKKIGSTAEPKVTVQVTFGNFFTVGCRPIITTGLVTRMDRVFVTVAGIGQLHPDNRGFTLQAIGDQRESTVRIASDIFVNWTAIGY